MPLGGPDDASIDYEAARPQPLPSASLRFRSIKARKEDIVAKVLTRRGDHPGLVPFFAYLLYIGLYGGERGAGVWFVFAIVVNFIAPC